MRSKEKELNFTDYKQLNCYRYIEENDTIEEPFYQTNDSKLCKYFTSCYYFNTYLCFFFQQTKLRHLLGVILSNTSQVKRILKFSKTSDYVLFFFPVGQLQKGGYILSIEKINILRQLSSTYLVFVVLAVYKGPSHSHACCKRVHENTNN